MKNKKIFSRKAIIGICSSRGKNPIKNKKKKKQREIKCKDHETQFLDSRGVEVNQTAKS